MDGMNAHNPAPEPEKAMASHSGLSLRHNWEGGNGSRHQPVSVARTSHSNQPQRLPGGAP